VKFTLTFGKHVGQGRLSPEQQSVVERLERDEITAQQAEKLLGGSVRVFDFTIGTAAEEDGPPPETPAAESAELSEDEIARRLVQRIVQEVDAEMGG
jgi:hypothetical protein